MKMFLSQIIIILFVINAGFEGGQDMFLISASQATVISQKLHDYESGKLGLEALGENAGSDEWRQLIGYYLLHQNDISPKAKLPIARCYAHFNMISQATELGEQYVEVYSNDWRGWRLLGYCYDVTNNGDKAIYAYGNAAKLGPKIGYERLAGCAVRNNRYDIVKGIVPQLLAIKMSSETPKEDKLSVITILLSFAMVTERKDIFLETLQGEDMNTILKNKSIRQDIETGCAIFIGEDINKIHNELENFRSNDPK